jgi:hypothetical protein
MRNSEEEDIPDLKRIPICILTQDMTEDGYLCTPQFAYTRAFARDIGLRDYWRKPSQEQAKIAVYNEVIIDFLDEEDEQF